MEADAEYQAALEGLAATDGAEPPDAPQSAQPEQVPPEPEPTVGFRVGDLVKHAQHGYDAKVIAIGKPDGPSWHVNKIAIRFEQKLPGNKKQRAERWCMPVDLRRRSAPAASVNLPTPVRTTTTSSSIPTESTTSSSSSSSWPSSTESTRAKRSGIDSEVNADDVLHDMVPELAAHERGRKLSSKSKGSGGGTARAASGAHRTVQTNVPVQQRVDSFPQQSLMVATTPKGKVIFCRCCPKEIENILGTIKTHVTSKRHGEKLIAWIEKNRNDAEVKDFLHMYFEQHSEEKFASLSEDVRSCSHS
jgi:hypothetical protein